MYCRHPPALLPPAPLPNPCDRGANVTWQQQHLVSTAPLALALIPPSNLTNVNQAQICLKPFMHRFSGFTVSGSGHFWVFRPIIRPFHVKHFQNWQPGTLNKIVDKFWKKKKEFSKKKPESKIIGVVTCPLPPFPHYTDHNTLRPPLPPLRKHPPRE